MALYRNISVSFWTDRKIDDDFSPEEKYFFLYLLTNPHTNICGCYEIGFKQMAKETGYTVEKIKHLLENLEKEHDVIRYDKFTKEVLIINWSKYNWSSSENLKKAVEKSCEKIKSGFFKKILSDYIYNNININNNILQYTESESAVDTAVDTATATATATVVTIPYEYGMDTVSEKPKNRGFIQEIEKYTDNKELQQALDEFVKMRRTIKAPLTERALTLCFNNLDKLGNNDEMKTAIVNQSIANSWKGLFPLKQERKEEKPDTDVEEYKAVINKFLY